MNTDKTMEFGGHRITPDVRKLYDMKEVLYDTDWLKTATNVDLYYMYRDLSMSRHDRSVILDNALRYDITVIPPNKLGRELVKTAGHYHPYIDGTGLTYPEIYEVLKGKAHYLIQKRTGDTISDVILIEAGEGDKVIIPPNYGHVTINPSPNKELMMSNWVSRAFSSIYEPYKQCGGAAYFELADGRFVRNEKCGPVPEMRFLKPTNIAKLGLGKGKEMYGFIRDVDKLAYLNRPQEYGWLWDDILSDKNRAGTPTI